MAAELCKLNGINLALTFEVCLKDTVQKHCYEQMEEYQLSFANNQIRMGHPEQPALTYDLGKPPKDVMTDPGHVEYFDALKNEKPGDTYQKYSIQAKREGNSVHLHKETSAMLFGRWKSSTRTVYAITFDETCNQCALVEFSAHTDKIGFSPNLQAAGSSQCIIK